jgi:hypothetical protein
MINRISNYISGLVEAIEYRYGGSNQRLDGGILWNDPVIPIA